MKNIWPYRIVGLLGMAALIFAIAGAFPIHVFNEVITALVL